MKLTKVSVGLVLAGAAIVLAGCGEKVVDGKGIVEVPVPATSGTPSPPPVTCYLLEVDRGTEGEESYYCATREEFDKNTIGEEWVGADGKKK
jgi:hypothetical protein